MAWTPEQKKLCLEMVANGRPRAAIMAATGFTMGQVSGFTYRAKFGGRSPKAAKKAKPPVEHRARIKIEPVPIRQKHAFVLPFVERKGSDKPVTIMELTSEHCRWMLDDTHYCGAVTVVKNKQLQSYCENHYQIAYRPARNAQNS